LNIEVYDSAGDTWENYYKAPYNKKTDSWAVAFILGLKYRIYFNDDDNIPGFESL
jgi:hypothetical protein